MNDSILTRQSLYQAEPLTPFQAQLDEQVSHFTEEATNWRSMIALSTGGIAYRLGRIGALSLASRASVTAPLWRAVSYGVGVGSEAGVFEWTHRSLLSLSDSGSASSLWRWSGQGGWEQSLLSSCLTFGMLRASGHFVQSQNILCQHLFTDLSLLGARSAAAAFGGLPQPEGDFSQQLFQAELQNLQWHAAMALGHTFTGYRWLSWERALDLSLSLRSERFLSERSFPRGPALQEAGAFGRGEFNSPSGEPLEPWRKSSVLMSRMEEVEEPTPLTQRLVREKRVHETEEGGAQPFQIYLYLAPHLLAASPGEVFPVALRGEHFMLGRIVERKTVTESHPFFRKGTVQIELALVEGPSQGKATLYWEGDSHLHLSSLQTRIEAREAAPEMREGARDIFLEWLSSQAAIHKMSFNVWGIRDWGQVAAVFTRGLVDPFATQVEACDWNSQKGDTYRLRERYFANNVEALQRNREAQFFNVRGMPHSRLLPHILRPRNPRRP